MGRGVARGEEGSGSGMGEVARRVVIYGRLSPWILGASVGPPWGLLGYSLGTPWGSQTEM